jgi:hypothetical protein
LYTDFIRRRPAFGEFVSGRGLVVANANLQANKNAFAHEFVDRAEFIRKYPNSMSAAQFVDALLAVASKSSGAGLSAQRAELLGLYNGNNSGRVAIIRRLAESEAFAQAEYNRAFVLMQYFGFLRRDPDERGFEFWLNVLQNQSATDTSAYRAMVCSFLSSTEYQSRFGMTMTHTNDECGR